MFCYIMVFLAHSPLNEYYLAKPYKQFTPKSLFSLWAPPKCFGVFTLFFEVGCCSFASPETFPICTELLCFFQWRFEVEQWGLHFQKLVGTKHLSLPTALPRVNLAMRNSFSAQNEQAGQGAITQTSFIYAYSIYLDFFLRFTTSWSPQGS